MALSGKSFDFLRAQEFNMHTIPREGFAKLPPVGVYGVQNWGRVRVGACDGNEFAIRRVKAPQIRVIGKFSKGVSVLSWVDMYLFTSLGIRLIGENPFQEGITFTRLPVGA